MVFVGNTPEAVVTIFDGLAWLGLPYGGVPVYQSNNEIRHREIAYALVERGAAYLDYTTPDELEAMRTAWAAKSKAPFRYIDNPWRDMPYDMAASIDLPYVIRLKAPREGSTTVHNIVQGEVTVANSEIDVSGGGR